MLLIVCCLGLKASYGGFLLPQAQLFGPRSGRMMENRRSTGPANLVVVMFGVRRGGGSRGIGWVG
jgi:hypothetical protein